jgi:hypothetical protein
VAEKVWLLGGAISEPRRNADGISVSTVSVKMEVCTSNAFEVLQELILKAQTLSTRVEMPF